jgi:hypothetical protein
MRSLLFLGATPPDPRTPLSSLGMPMHTVSVSHAKKNKRNTACSVTAIFTPPAEATTTGPTIVTTTSIPDAKTQTPPPPPPVSSVSDKTIHTHAHKKKKNTATRTDSTPRRRAGARSCPSQVTRRAQAGPLSSTNPNSCFFLSCRQARFSGIVPSDVTVAARCRQRGSSGRNTIKCLYNEKSCRTPPRTMPLSTPPLKQILEQPCSIPQLLVCTTST